MMSLTCACTFETGYNRLVALFRRWFVTGAEAPTSGSQSTDDKRQHVPENCTNKRTMSSIQERTRGMVETAALAKVMDKLTSGVTWITIKGQPGEGKSTAAFMALGRLQQSGREVFKINTPEEFFEVTSTCPRPVIMLDDILGNLDFDQSAWSRWKPVIDDILEESVHTLHEKLSKEKDVTVILVSRNDVLNNVSNDIGKVARYFTDVKNVVFMSNREERTTSEKFDILKAICESKDCQLDERTMEIICNTDGPHGFPHTCRLFVTFRKEGVEVDTEQFMKSPLQFLNQTVKKFLEDDMKLLLFKEMLKRDGKISVSDLQSFDNNYVLRILLDNLVDSYLRIEDDSFAFHHPSIYDSVAFNLAKYFPSFVIKHCSLSFLLERLRLEQSCDAQHATPSSDSYLFANIPRRFILELAKRFALEIECRNLFVLSHKALIDELFIEELMRQITLPLIELLTLRDKQPYYSFLSFVPINNSPLLLKYIDNQKDIRLTNFGIYTILYWVCECAASDVLTYLVQSRDTLDINVRYELDKTPLMIASYTRDSQFVQQILSLGPDLNARSSGLDKTVLHYLCENGLVVAVEQVIDRVGSVNVVDVNGWSPLCLACMNKHLDVARVMADRGARVDAETVVRACYGGNLDLVKLLYERGATINMTTGSSTPLTAASQGGNLKVMRFLIDKGASVNTTNRLGWSLLHFACSSNSLEVVKCLLDNNADINGIDMWGKTPLDKAVEWGSNQKCVEVLQIAIADREID